MKFCPLTRISSPAPEICPNVLLTGYVFYTERVCLYCHGPTEHRVILVGGILHAFYGFMISLECESLASWIQFEASNAHTIARHSFSMIGYLTSCWRSLLSTVQLSFIILQQYSCYSNFRCICSQVRKIQYWFL